ncbi:5' DNA nuclease [Agrobacterium vitis]|uniref:5' DNA nuclease n=1 Tax=Agrobacterium vitis TaxID=373 RepID=UPI001F21506F|nr:5' DNA nuclease [Agrobacterium vitis]MCF1466896.1 5' DNA nuclease [Agrobacterium vitis]
MVEASKQTGTDVSAKSADTSRGAEMAGSSLHALMANPMAAFAAATVLGFGFATQMTGVMLGSMQTMMDKPARRTKEDKAEAVPASGESEVSLKPETQAPKSVEAPVSDALALPKVAPARRPVAKAKSKPVKSPAVRSAKKTIGAPVTPIAEPEVKAAPVAVKPARRRGKKVDLKAIGGVGPKVQEMLSKLGVHGLDDIATWTPEDATRIDEELGLDGRILRDDWIGQARKLTGA